MANNKPVIPIENFNQGGLADSRWSGVKDSNFRMVGLDPHSQPGILKVEQSSVKIGQVAVEDTIDEFCEVSVACSNGKVYWFSAESGKIWEINKTTKKALLVHTTTPATGEAKCLGAKEYGDYIYWFTQNKIHRIAVANAADDDWATDVAEDWATFTNGDLRFHPSFVNSATQILYIGDANLVAQIDDVTFTADALDITSPLRISCFGQLGTDLLIGTYVSDYITKTQIFRWNTWSVSFTTADEIPEVGINAFIPSDNFVLVQAGLAGNLYLYNGETLELYKKIPGNYSPSAYGGVNPNAVANNSGQMLLGFSNGGGNPALCGVYRIARHDRKYPFIMDLAYVISELDSEDEFILENVEIGAVVVSGLDVLYSWRVTVAGDPITYLVGVDMVDSQNKRNGAYLETRVMNLNREQLNTISNVYASYYELPTDTEIQIELDKNYDDFEAATTRVDTDRKIVELENAGFEATTFAVRIKFVTSGNDAPQMESGAVEVN